MQHMPRQNWRAPTSTTRYSVAASCTPYHLPSGLSIPLADTTTVLTSAIVVTPACYTAFPSPTGQSVHIKHLRDPFYASTIPMAYSIAATSTLAYVLLLLLFLPNPPHSRPWLQKVATLSVCICLTIAFAETTNVLRDDYNLAGSSVFTLTNEAREVRSQVNSGVHLKIGRIISDCFLWLAQVQTLIRLFPRQREKMVIKWTGFALIVLDTLFSVLESFVSPMASTDSFLDAIPALSYLFQICCSTMYAGCVIYYSIAKRRYSYFYPHRPFSPHSPGTKKYGGRSIFLVAILSICSILTPLVFFIVDIAQKDLAGWGDYVRWVGAAASSVVVWEWVDRIEGLEREEKKGGVLGREVYDEDEDLRFTGSDNAIYEVSIDKASTTDHHHHHPPTSPPSPPKNSKWPWKSPAAKAALKKSAAAITQHFPKSRAVKPSTPSPPPAQLPVTIIPPPPRARRSASGYYEEQGRRSEGSASTDAGSGELPVFVVPPPMRQRGGWEQQYSQEGRRSEGSSSTSSGAGEPPVFVPPGGGNEPPVFAMPPPQSRETGGGQLPVFIIPPPVRQRRNGDDGGGGGGGGGVI
jgi:hypothetical protein